MAREWKPGNVALVDSWRGKGQIAFRTLRGDRAAWCVLDDIDTRGLEDNEVTIARPLVVIDFEDREQVERLLSAFADALKWGPHNMQRQTYVEPLTEALREFANPTPPRPEEPTGLGAVVEDERGRLWTRTCTVRCLASIGDEECHPWIGADADDDESVDYADIEAVRVLSEGVTA